MVDRNSAISAIRFGYGLGRGYRGAGSAAALLRELETASIVPKELASNSSAERLKEEVATRRAKLRAPGPDGKPLDQTARRKVVAQIQAGKLGDFIEDCHRKITAAVMSPSPFFERLVAFWSNHLTVSAKNGAVRQLCGPYEIEAIRPNVMGSFEEMLLAAEMHPAMFYYLDQHSSIGPNSPIGKRTGKGLNENLAREILELHTIGVAAGYTQDDIRAFAAIMTGWQIVPGLGTVKFRANRHEPGTKRLLGRDFAPGEQGFGEALQMLARHPATARTVAVKLARHFISPTPPEKAVKALENTFLRTNGFLPDLYRTLVNLPEVWEPPRANVRTHYEFVVAALRTTDLGAEALDAVPHRTRPRPNPLSYGALVAMGQQPWTAPSPAGWPEDPEEWMTPSGLARRLNWVTQIIPHIKDPGPLEFAQRVLGPVMSERTHDVLTVSSNREEGLALVLASPEFNRR